MGDGEWGSSYKNLQKRKEDNSHYYHIKLKAIYFGLSTESKNTNILVRIIEALHIEVFVYKIEKDRENRNGDYPSLKTKCFNPKGNVYTKLVKGTKTAYTYDK